MGRHGKGIFYFHYFKKIYAVSAKKENVTFLVIEEGL